MSPAPEETLAQRYRLARRDPELTVVEGFHALKHALRFGAEIVEAVAVDPERLEELAGELAPDLAGQLSGRVERIDAGRLVELVPRPPRTGVAAIARRPPVDLAATLADPRPAPVVLLEDLGAPIGDAPSIGLGDRAAREALAVVTSSYEHHGGFRLRTLA